MSLWDHVDALRAVLIKIVVVLVAVACVLFVYMPEIFDNVILAPCKGDFVLYRLFENITAGIPSFPQFTTEGFEVKLINIQLASQFFIHMSASFWLALVITFPVMIYLDIHQPCTVSRREKGFQKGVRHRQRHVLDWCGCRLFPCVPHHITIFSRLPCERNGAQPNLARQLYGHIPYAHIHYGHRV